MIFDAIWLAAAIRLSVPLLLAATGELVSERAGVLNLGIEGMMLSGAFGAYWVTAETGSIAAGMVGGVASGIVVGLVMAVVTLMIRADQIVVGIGLNILALGGTGFALESAFESSRPTVDRPATIGIPLLEDIPWVGEGVFQQTMLAYFAFAAIAVVAVMLRFTGLGLSINAVGENRSAALAAGVHVSATQWFAVLTAGAFAGLAGAFLSVGSVGFFSKNMTAGRGFIAIAVVIFGRWRPSGVLVGSLLFGAVAALQLRLQAESSVPALVWLLLAIAFALPCGYLYVQGDRGVRVGVFGAAAIGFAALAATSPEITLPSQLWLAAQYLVALLVLLVGTRRSNMPRQLGEVVE